jgi:hypothetical protein
MNKDFKVFHERELSRIVGERVTIETQNPGDGRRYWAELASGMRLSHSLPYARFREWCFGFEDGAAWRAYNG